MNFRNEKIKAAILTSMMVMSVIALGALISPIGAVNTNNNAAPDNLNSASGIQVQTVNFNVTNSTSGTSGDYTTNTTGNNQNGTITFGEESGLNFDSVQSISATNSSGTDVSDAFSADVNDTSNTVNVTINANSSDINTSGNEDINVSVDVNIDTDSATTTGSATYTLHNSSNTATTGSFSITNGNITNSTGDVSDSEAVINVAVSPNAPSKVNESTINLNVTNVNTSETFQIVENGQVITGSATSNANFTDGVNSDTEFVNVSAQLKEGHYNFSTVSAEDTAGNAIINDSSFNGESDFFVNMSGSQYLVIPDPSNPFAASDINNPSSDEIANVSVVVQDTFGNNITLNDGNIGATDNDTVLSVDDANGDINRTGPTSGNGTQAGPITFEVVDSQAEDITLIASDNFSTNGTVNSGQATQTFSAQIDDVNVTSASDTLPADGSTRANVTLQLVDTNGNDVAKSGVGLSWSTNNGSAAGISIDNSNTTTSTNSNGQAFFVFTASNSGETVTVRGTTNQAGHTDATDIQTIAGEVSASNSQLRYDGSTSDNTSKVASTHDVSAEILDNQGNAIEGMDATFSANTSGVTFGSTTVTSNSNGFANTTVTLPEEKKPVQINVSSGDFNATATGSAQINVSLEAENATQLAFGSDSRVISASGQKTLEVQVQDEFGNINETNAAQTSITLESDDQNTITVDGGQSNTNTSQNGVATFDIADNSSDGSGSATLSATNTAGLTNASDTWMIATPTDIQLQFMPRTSISTTSTGNANQTTLQATLVDSSGNTVDIDNENISFARLSGNAASLPNNNVVNTNGGVATIQITATQNTGQTRFLAQSENFSADGRKRITTVGDEDTLNIEPNKTTSDVGSPVGLDVTFRDSQDRVVPLNGSASLNTDHGTLGSTPIQIQPDSTGTVHANTTINASSEGIANISAISRGLGDEVSVEFTTGPEPANFNITSISAPGSADVDESIDVSADITNEGGQQGQQTVEFRLDTDNNGTLETDEEVTNTSLTLNAGASDTVNFTVTIPTLDNGTYNHGFFTANSSSTAQIDITNVTDLEPPESYDTNNNGQIDRSELRAAILDFVNDDLSRSGLRAVIIAFVNDQT